MPNIRPFLGTRPNPEFAGKVVLDVENLNIRDAKLIRRENPYSYVNMLVPEVDNIFLRGSKNELAFKKINENFEEFLDRGILIKDQQPSVYVYRVSREGRSQTGIWALSAVDDYLNGRIKKHELTRPEREEVLVNYLEQTGIDANPVLIAYPSLSRVDQVLQDVTSGPVHLQFRKNGALHELWQIGDKAIIDKLVEAFAGVDGYIADGHHRASSAALLALRRRSLKQDYTGEEEFNFFTSVYMSSDELEIYPFYRVVKDLNGLDKETLLSRISDLFAVGRSNGPLVPREPGEFGMYLDGQWYSLVLKPGTLAEPGVVNSLDVSILQRYVLSALLGIGDARSDQRLNFYGGVIPPDQMTGKIDSGEYAILFSLFPLSTAELMAVADAGEVMPPKSTWFEPKFQAGLLIHQVS